MSDYCHSGTESLGTALVRSWNEICQEREELMRPLMEELVAETGEVEVDVRCPECGFPRKRKGLRSGEFQTRTVR